MDSTPLLGPTNACPRKPAIEALRAADASYVEFGASMYVDSAVSPQSVLPGGRGGLLDWQLMMRGSWAHDVVYLIVTALAPAVRRAHQHDLLGEYLDRLGAAGVRDAPTPHAAFDQCRAAALWGMLHA